MKEYLIKLKNSDGVQDKLTRKGRNIKEAQDLAIEDANNGYLSGKGWTVLWAREVEK